MKRTLAELNEEDWIIVRMLRAAAKNGVTAYLCSKELCKVYRWVGQQYAPSCLIEMIQAIDKESEPTKGA